MFAYVVGQLNTRAGDYQRAISERLALLGNRVGSEFEAEIRTRVADLHAWQEQALKKAAASQAQETIGLI